MQLLTPQLVEQVAQQAAVSPRKRQNYNFHKSLDEAVHRMLNALEPDTYIRAHRHSNPTKLETLLIMQGTLLTIIFDDNGNIVQHHIMNRDNGVWGIEIPPHTWHTLISLEKGSVMFETKQGPFEPIVESDFAAWAPTDTNDGLAYNQSLIKQLGL